MEAHINVVIWNCRGAGKRGFAAFFVICGILTAFLSWCCLNPGLVGIQQRRLCIDLVLMEGLGLILMGLQEVFGCAGILQSGTFKFF